MIWTKGKLSVLLLTMGLFCGVLPAQDPLEAPLPTGAIMRLGTTRFRPGENVGILKLSPDGKKLITCQRGGAGLSVWDATSGKLLLRRPQGQYGEISRDGDRLFVIETDPVSTAKPPDDPKTIVPRPGQKVLADLKCDLNIYDINSSKRIQQIRTSQPLVHFAIAPNERTLALEYAVPAGANEGGLSAVLPYKSRVELYDLKAGRVLHKLPDALPKTGLSRCVRFSADGKTLFAVGISISDNSYLATIKRFDAATGALQSTKEVNVNASYCYEPLHTTAGKTLIAWGGTIWDLDKEQVYWTSKEKFRSIIAFMPDGRSLVGWAWEGGGLVHWDMQADRAIRTMDSPSAHAQVVISPDGKIGYGESWAYRWIRFDMATGKEIDSADAPTEPAHEIAFSPDGKYVATVNHTYTSTPGKSFDREYPYYVVRVWDRATGKCLHQMRALDVKRIFFAQDSATLANGAVGTDILTLDMATWKKTKRTFELLPVAQFEYLRSISNYPCRPSPDGKVLVSTTALWDWTTGKLIGKLEHKFPEGSGIDQTEPFAVSADGKQLTCVGYARVEKEFTRPQKRVQIWSLADRKLISDNPISNWPTVPGLSHVQFADGGKVLTASWFPPRPPWRGMLRTPEAMRKPIPDDWPETMPPMPDAIVRGWDSASGKEKFHFRYPQNENMGGETPPVFSPDGKLAATANYLDEFVYFRDLTGKEVGRFDCGVKGASVLTFSPDGQVLAVSAKDTTVLLVDVRKVLSKP